MKPIEIKSVAQREMLERCAVDAAEARRRGMTRELAQASLDAHPATGHRVPKRLGPLRPNRHGRARP